MEGVTGSSPVLSTTYFGPPSAEGFPIGRPCYRMLSDTTRCSVKTRNENGTENGTDAERLSAQGDKVRGVRKLKPRADRPKPYGVEWRIDGRPKTEWYASENERDKRYEVLMRERGKGTLARVLSKQEIVEWAAFRASIGDADWRDVVAGWRAHNVQVTGLAAGSTLTVQDAGKTYLAAQQTRHEAKKLSADTLRQKKRKVGAFVDAFGANLMVQIKAEDISAWIEDDLGFTNGDTFDSWVAHLGAFFSFFAKELRFNPCEEIESRGGHVEYVKILSVRDTARLFEFALNHRRVAIGRLAIEAFAGLRFGSSSRLEKHDINFEDKGIMLPAAKLKTGMVDGRRHYIDGLPENLWAWLKVATPDGWTLSGSEWMHEKTQLFADAKVPHPRNCLRHSFATYHVAAFKNPGLVATILCHTNQEKLWSNYNGNATSAFGKRYFEITPETCARIAREAAEQRLPDRHRISQAPGAEFCSGGREP